MLAKHALYQLSYGPIGLPRSVVGPGGLEPPTSRLSGVRSNQLSYRPEAMALVIAFQPSTEAQSLRAAWNDVWKGRRRRRRSAKVSEPKLRTMFSNRSIGP